MITDCEDTTAFDVAAAFLGVGTGKISNGMDAHKLIEDGIPAAAVQTLIANVSSMNSKGFMEKALGMSLRTFQRTKNDKDRLLSLEQSGRTWRFVEILALATQVMGSQEEAEAWLSKPALGLDGALPIDLMTTPAGAKIVDEHLMRLDFGVYA